MTLSLIYIKRLFFKEVTVEIKRMSLLLDMQEWSDVLYVRTDFAIQADVSFWNWNRNSVYIKTLLLSAAEELLKFKRSSSSQ